MIVDMVRDTLGVWLVAVVVMTGVVVGSSVDVVDISGVDELVVARVVTVDKVRGSPKDVLVRLVDTPVVMLVAVAVTSGLELLDAVGTTGVLVLDASSVVVLEA